MNQKFEAAWRQLNPKQKQAIKLLDGPVLVVAGPGTGKTQLLSMRVAHILRATDTKPSNILCLTFTNKAAVNMKERIITLAGPAGAKVQASTFHSFSAEIMSLYPDYFWNGARLSTAPDSIQLDIIELILKRLPLDNPLALKFAGKYTLLSDVQQAIKLTKEAGLTPKGLRLIIEANLAYLDVIESPLTKILNKKLSPRTLPALREAVNKLPKQEINQFVYPLTSLSSVLLESLDAAISQDEDTGKCANTSKWKSRWMQNERGQKGTHKERARNLWWLELASLYELYRDELHQKGFYDYADMLVEVIAQLEAKPDLLADIQERFNYVLIDEFQDTTPAQMRLAHLVSGRFGNEGRPNLMVVGDDDQSIFKFNGAELNNMLRFKEAYPGTEIIILTGNYRSTQKILDTAEKIIDQAESRLVNSDPTLIKKLKALNPPAGASQIAARAYPSQELEMSVTARQIKKAYKPGREIAVLARGHDSLIKMAGLLKAIDVPVRYEQASNILEHEIINQVYLIAKLISAISVGDQRASDLIHQIIRWPAWGLQPTELWELATGNYPDKNWLRSLINSERPQLAQIGQWFMDLAAQADNQPLAITIEQILGLRPTGQFTSPVKDYFALASRAYTNRYFHGLSAIQLLRAMVHEFSAGSEPTVNDLARFIEVNKDNQIIVADESPFITGEGGVHLLTVHKAKGLEFDEVYIIDAIEDNWRAKSERRKPPANLPLRPPLDDFDDYVRLMYVAVTRAKSSLFIIAHYQDHSGKDVAPSAIAQAAVAFKRETEDDPKKLITVLEENLRWPDLAGGAEKQMLKARLETYNLSVTHLINFLDVTRGGPQYFKERDLLYLREARTPSLAYGSAMHSALDLAQKLTNQDGFSLAAVKKQFEKALRDEQLMSSDYQRWSTRGDQTLDRLFSDFKYPLASGSLSEQYLRDIRAGRAVIGGKLDRVDSAGGHHKIIDYKTGKPLISFDTRDKNQAMRAYKHKLQLIFYALILSESGQAKAGQIEGQMIYVDADNQKDLIRTYTPTAADIDEMRRLASAVWQKIVNVDLPDVSAYSQDLDGIKAFQADLLK
ncbi:MAG TPA: ATP-dependent DNA helicase [Candidatus Saccharimonadales bacterium]|nr:ATP-dependent DNA helicase [Candidatus Saccharimonadales bacterium]